MKQSAVRWGALALPLLVLAGCADPDPAERSDELRIRAERIHSAVITIDSRDDILFDFATDAVDPLNARRQVNFENMDSGGLDVGFFVVYVGQTQRTPGNYEQAKADVALYADPGRQRHAAS